MVLSQYFKKFFHSSQSSGILLIVCVIASLLLANSSAGEAFRSLLEKEVGPEALHLKYSVANWINDGLMTIFFLLVGLEIKREMLEGELSQLKSASLPIFAAVGGMIVPALIFAAFNFGTPYSNGWGIPMATDIAFSLAIVSILGRKVPPSVKIFLAALAIVDDLGAILVIAIFYTEKIEWLYLGLAGAMMLLLLLFNFLKITRLLPYLAVGVFLWYFMHHSGIHATIAGVLLAFTIPTNTSTTEISPLERLEEKLHIPVNFFIMPIFAFANTSIVMHAGMVDGLFNRFGLGIILGLAVGKVLGINIFSWIAVRLNISTLPYRSNWSHMLGAGFLAGIGFTMSIFIALLSFAGHTDVQEEAKFAILIASALSGFIGYVILNHFSKRKSAAPRKRKMT